MDIQLAAQHAYRLPDQLTADEIRQRAMDRRVGAFASGLGGLLSRPKTEEIELVDSQHRLEPFWHVACRARYVYDRTRNYTVPASSPPVQTVTVLDHDFTVSEAGRSFIIPVTEHCREELVQQTFVDGVTGQPVADAAALITGSRQEVDDLQDLSRDDTVVVHPEQRASFVVRQLLAGMLQPVQADTLIEESITFEVTDLYYRPWWAFDFLWKPKNKRAIVEIDGITGQSRPGQALIARVAGMVNRDALFDIGADTVGMLVPGGSIAVKVARLAIDQNRAT